MLNTGKTKHILFITSSRIGDAVLSFGLLDELLKNNPSARLTIACGNLVASLCEGIPNLEGIIPIKKQKFNKHWFEVWKQTIGTRFDTVVDLRNSAVSRLIWAKKRYIFGGHIDQTCHKVEQNAAVMNLAHVPPPRLWLSDAQLARAELLIPAGAPVLGVGATANWRAKTWPTERFIKIIKWMTEKGGLMPDARIAVFAAPGEESEAYKVYEALQPQQRINLIAKTDPGTAAACLTRCAYYLGNDSGLMHCAAAAKVPTFGLFGPSYPKIYRPWGAHTAYAATPETFDELIAFEGYNSKTVGTLMGSLTVDAVKTQIKQNWAHMAPNLNDVN